MPALLPFLHSHLRLCVFSLGLLVTSLAQAAASYFHPAQPWLYYKSEDGRFWLRQFDTGEAFHLSAYDEKFSLVPQANDRPWLFHQAPKGPRTLIELETGVTYTLPYDSKFTYLWSIRDGRYVYANDGNPQRFTALYEFDLKKPAAKPRVVLKSYDQFGSAFSPDGSRLIFKDKDEVILLDLARDKRTRLHKEPLDSPRWGVRFVDPTGRGWVGARRQTDGKYRYVFRNFLGEEVDLTSYYDPNVARSMGTEYFFQIIYDGFRNRLTLLQRRDGKPVVIVVDPSGKQPAREMAFADKIDSWGQAHLMPGGAQLLVREYQPRLRFAEKFTRLDLVKGTAEDGFLQANVGVIETGEYRYTGELLAGKRHGLGECVWKNGRTYTGGWLDDQPHGEGQMLAGELKFKGEWDTGRIVTAQIDYTDAAKRDIRYTGPLNDQLKPEGFGLMSIFNRQDRRWSEVEGWFEAGYPRYAIVSEDTPATGGSRLVPVYVGLFTRFYAGKSGRLIKEGKMGPWTAHLGEVGYQRSFAVKPGSPVLTEEEAQSLVTAEPFYAAIEDVHRRIAPKLAASEAKRLEFERNAAYQARLYREQQARAAEEVRLAASAAEGRVLAERRRQEEQAEIEKNARLYDRNAAANLYKSKRVDFSQPQPVELYQVHDFVAAGGKIYRIAGRRGSEILLSDGEYVPGNRQFFPARVKAQDFAKMCQRCIGRGTIPYSYSAPTTTTNPYSRTYTSEFGTTWHETGMQSTTTYRTQTGSMVCRDCNGKGKAGTYSTLSY